VRLADARSWPAAVGFGAVLAIALLLPLFGVGVPAYMHDWTWPPDPAGLREQLLQGWEPWVDDGLGHPNPYPSALPHFVVLALLAGAVPARVLLGVLLLATFVTAFAGASSFTRRVFGLGIPSLACGALYAAAPLTLTKLVAGHLSYLQAYAAFPFFALALREAHGSLRWSALGALAVGVTAVQPQFFGYEVVYALGAIVTGSATPRALRNIALLALPLMLPTLIGPTLNARGEHGVLAHQHAVIAWEQEQSAPPLDALLGLGYFTRYVDRLAPPYALSALALVPLLALAAAAQRLRDSRDARALLVCAAAGWLLVVGLNGPLALPARWAFLNVAPLSVFRELFDAMVLYWFPLCVLAAMALARLPRTAAALAVVAVAGTLAVPWSRYASYFVAAPDAATLRSVSALAQRDARTRGDSAAGRVVWWPALQPLGVPDHAQGGSDPLARTPLDGFSPLYEYQPEGRFGTAVAFARAGRWDEAAPIFGWLGVRYLVTRDGIVSFASGSPRRTMEPRAPLRAIGRTGAFTVYRVDAVRALATVEPPVRGDDLLLTPFTASLVDGTPQPGRVVAAFPYVWRNPAVADCGNAAVIADGATLADRGGAWIMAAPFDGGERCTWHAASALRSEGSRLFVAAGSADAVREPTPLPRVPLAEPRTIEESPGHWQIRITAPRDALLVVRTSYDARWRARIDGHDAGPPRAWNGFAAWPIAAGAHDVDVRYGGGAVTFALVIALMGLIANVALAVWPHGAVLTYRFHR
jgi:hypothetical protein